MAPRLTDDFDAWARLSALLLRTSPVEGARIIRDAGAEKEWHSADAHWYQTLLADVEAGRSDRIDVYRRICVEAMGRRRRRGDTVPSPLDVLQREERDDEALSRSSLPGGWTVEDYAWLCAELESSPKGDEQIWAARGITQPADQDAFRQAWERRLDASQGLRRRYDELLAAYRAVIRQDR